MSIAQQASEVLPHAIWLQVDYRDRSTGTRVERTKLLRGPDTTPIDTAYADALVLQAVHDVIDHASEAADASVTIALLKQS